MWNKGSDCFIEINNKHGLLNYILNKTIMTKAESKKLRPPKVWILVQVTSEK